MQSAGTIRTGWKRDEKDKILTPGGEYNQNHGEAKLTRQLKAIKENFGMGSLLGLLSMIVSIIVAVMVIGTPVYKQGEIQGASAKAIEGLEKAQKETKEEQARALSEAVMRIEAGIKQAVDLAQQNREEMRAMRTSTDGAFVELRQDTKGLWKWATSIDGRVGVLEAEIKQKK